MIPNRSRHSEHASLVPLALFSRIVIARHLRIFSWVDETVAFAEVAVSLFGYAANYRRTATACASDDARKSISDFQNSVPLRFGTHAQKALQRSDRNCKGLAH